MMDGDEIAELIHNIPCSFSLSVTVVKKTKTSLEVIIAKLLKEDQMCIYDTEEEVIRDHNLLSYLFWCTGNAKKAFEFNKKALERSDKNITAAVNKIWFYLELHSPYEAKTAFEHFQTVKQNKHYETIVLTGKAEIAYAYTRLGFRHYERAVDEFNEVLSQADKWPDLDKNSVYLWKAGLGLTLRRLSHTGNVGNPLEMQRTKQRLREAVEVFVELVESDWDSERNKAFSYVQLAQVAESVEWANLPPNEYFPVKYRRWDIETFYHMAEKHCKGDTYTLETTVKLVDGSRFRVHGSRFAVHGSRFTIHSSRFTVHGSRFTVHGSRFTVHSSRFTVHDSQFTVHGSRFAVHGSRFTIHSSRFTIRS